MPKLEVPRPAADHGLVKMNRGFRVVPVVPADRAATAAAISAAWGQSLNRAAKP